MTTEVQDNTQNGAGDKPKEPKAESGPPLHRQLTDHVERTVDALGTKSKGAYLGLIPRVMAFPPKERARVLADLKALFELAGGQDKLLTAVKTTIGVTVKS